ncbi:EAL domain-containing protein [Bacillus timonensis]|nr:EAL domain-containing protein [Bacillus timonensis]
MDALEIMTNLHLVVPYYQAVFSADEHKVIGYEVLGRYQTDDEVISLGAFFSDDSIPDEYRIEVDNLIVEKAITALIDTEEDVYLFINKNANLLMTDSDETFLNMLLSFQAQGVSLNKIVLEVTEHQYTGDIDQLYHLLTYYRTYGLKIAVDNIGKESSNLDRIGLLTPDILKVDLQALRKTSTSQSYFDVLYTISLLARKIGATLLYEDIETLFQLQFAWSNGGRYYQGYYLHQPCEKFVSADFQKGRLKQEIHQFTQQEKKKIQSRYILSDLLQNEVSLSLGRHKNLMNYNELITELALDLKDKTFRIYICDEDGFQQSANYFKHHNLWTLQREYENKNWSWRPYFLENIMRMKRNKKGILSDLYSDIETGEMIRTFSYPLTVDHYLFVDIPYQYLYENEGLL